jgi:F420-0:gamma-glutamyl ligase-like protein
MRLRDKAEAIETGYWMPGDDYLEIIAGALEGRIDDGDIVTVSEKALSTAKGRIIDESPVKPGVLAKVLARLWMRICWGYFLGLVCRLRNDNIRRLRSYPLKEGGAHKQVALWHASFLQSLLWGSEGGIDASNLPYSYVSLPLADPRETAEEIRRYVRDRLGKGVAVMIVDTDKTYSRTGFHITHRPKPLNGIYSFFGVVGYVSGRAFGMRRRSTPLSVAGTKIDVDLALDLAEAANRRRGSGAGLTVWDMADTFGVSITSVTWEMLRGLKHKPIVVFKLGKSSQ